MIYGHVLHPCVCVGIIILLVIQVVEQCTVKLTSVAY